MEYYAALIFPKPENMNYELCFSWFVCSEPAIFLFYFRHLKGLGLGLGLDPDSHVFLIGLLEKTFQRWMFFSLLKPWQVSRSTVKILLLYMMEVKRSTLSGI